jgi:hypothetical protein
LNNHPDRTVVDELSELFVSHEQGKAQVHSTQQVCDEFKRNREVPT